MQVRKFFIFQVLVSFFGSFIAGSLLNQVQQIIQDPSSIVQVLGNAAPQTAGEAPEQLQTTPEPSGHDSATSQWRHPAHLPTRLRSMSSKLNTRCLCLQSSS